MNEVNNIVKVRQKDYLRLLGFPKQYIPEAKILEMIKWAQNWYTKNGRPWVQKYDIDILYDTEHHFYANGVRLESQVLNKRFSEAKVDKAVMLVASAGKELEQKAAEYWKKGIPDNYYFLEIYGSAVVEELISSNTRNICGESEQNGYSVLDRYSPGYYGWDISGQHDLFKIIEQSENKLPEDKLRILNSGMLWPKKSQISLNGLSRHTSKSKANQLPCLTCFYENCQFRKAPFREKLSTKN